MAVGVAHKVMRILETLLEKPVDMDLREIASRTGLPKSTVHRILSSLEEDRWILQNKTTRRYQLGAKIMLFADANRVQSALVAAAEEPMKELVKQTGETTVLAVLDGDVARCVHVVESPNALKFSFRVGGTLPLHAGAVGKVIGAFSPPPVRQRIASRKLEAYTQNTITDPEALLKEFEETKNRGYSVSIEEVDPGGTAVGAPVFFRNERFLAALIISGPRTKFENKTEDLATQVMATARKISREISGKE